MHFLPVSFFPTIQKIGNIPHIPVMGRTGHYLPFLLGKDLGDQRLLGENEMKAFLGHFTAPLGITQGPLQRVIQLLYFSGQPRENKPNRTSHNAA